MHGPRGSPRIRVLAIGAALTACIIGDEPTSADGTTNTTTTSTGGETDPAGTTSGASSTSTTSSTTASDASTTVDTSTGSTTASEATTGETTAGETTAPDETTASTAGETTESSSDGDETTGGFAGEVCALIIHQCVFSCYQLQWPCVDACIATGSPVGAAEAQAWVDCAFIDCNYDGACNTSFCNDEAELCQTGPMACPETVDCAQQCGDDDTCVARCWFESTAAAQKQYDSLVFCKNGEGCADLDDQCMKEFCTWEYMQCLGWP